MSDSIARWLAFTLIVSVLMTLCYGLASIIVRVLDLMAR